jgi:membrane fusion protein (multidrug efflux system)
MSVRSKTYSLLGFLIAFAIAGYLLVPLFTSDGSVSLADSAQSQQTSKVDQENSVAVEVAVARKGEISASVSSTANLKARREVALASQIEGVVRKVLVEEGDFVQKGQALCRLDDTQAQIRLQSSRQKLAQARLQLEKANILQDKSDVQLANTREEYERYHKLYEERLVSEREVAQVKYKLDELEHDLKVSSSESRELLHRVDELEAEIKQSELEISRTVIEAPFAGYITAREVDLGQTVRTMETLFKLGDFSSLQAEVFLSERDASRINPGQVTTVFSGVESTLGLQGRVVRISPVVDQATGTVKVTVELVGDNDLFKPGGFVRVDIRTDTREGRVLIPKRAVVEEDGDTFVFVASEDTVRRVNVALGYQNGGDVEVVEGVVAGDSVVVAGQGGLKEGSKIRRVEGASV